MSEDSSSRRPGPPRTGGLEPCGRGFKARVRLADGSRIRVDVPAKYCTPAGGKTGRERAELYAAALVEREQETGELLAAKQRAGGRQQTSASGSDAFASFGSSRARASPM